MVGWQRTITSVGETWWESSSVGKILGPCLFPLQPEKCDKLDLIFFFHRLHLLHIGVFLLRPGGKGLQTSGSRVGVGRPSLLRLAFPEIRPVWRRVAERRQRAVSHQQPQGALRRPPRGRGALVWVPEQDDASLRGLLLQVAQNGNKQKTDALLQLDRDVSPGPEFMTVFTTAWSTNEQENLRSEATAGVIIRLYSIFSNKSESFYWKQGLLSLL